MMSLWDALRMNMMISYQELVRTFPTYLNGERWNDEKPVVTSNSSGDSTPGGSASNSWFTPSNDGSSEVFINQAAIERLNRGGQRK
ncbi:hypothetical protein C3B80_03610 [Enterobacter cloacae]|nr:hypothetical protein C3B80_03610 [Enterobacter cloacae]